MSFRERLNTDRRLQAMIAGPVLILAVALLAYELWPSGPTAVSDQSFYTTDGGKTWFRDSLFKVPPFDQGGATAVRALVYRSSGTEFVAFLLRYRPETAKLVNEAFADQKAGKKSRDEVQALILSDRVRGGTEVAKPGPNPAWKRLDSVNLQNIKGPDGSPAEMVSP